MRLDGSMRIFPAAHLALNRRLQTPIFNMALNFLPAAKHLRRLYRRQFFTAIIFGICCQKIICNQGENIMKPILFWLLGLPIPVVIILWLLGYI